MDIMMYFSVQADRVNVASRVGDLFSGIRDERSE